METEFQTLFLGFGGSADGKLCIAVRHRGEDEMIEIDAAEFVRTGQFVVETRPAKVKADLKESAPFYTGD